MASIWLLVGLSVLGFLSYRAVRVWLDAGQLAVDPGPRMLWTMLGTLAPARYWWGVRLDAMSAEDRQDLLTGETITLGLARADAEHCPLCNAEIPQAWMVTARGQADLAPGRPGTARGSGKCPSCDFRLDACRHCTHFLPGPPQAWSWGSWDVGDSTSGRCSQYQSTQPVDEACSPQMARQLKSRGYDQIRAPLPILDSYLPPDSCTAFKADRKRLRSSSGIRWPDARRIALLRVLSSPLNGRAVPHAESMLDELLPAGDEEWLL